MPNHKLQETDLVLNSDGSVYHLHLHDEQIADNVIVVGDQGRVQAISKYFDKIDFKTSNREFVTHTGVLGKNRITVLSTGIGTDNIDIVINELDAAINIDHQTRKANDKLRKLNIVRIGTSGALQADIPVGSQVISQFGLGFDNLMHYYSHPISPIELKLSDAISKHLQWNEIEVKPYVCKGSDELFARLNPGMVQGITATAPGFYGPQGRTIRLRPKDTGINDKLQSFQHEGYRITNFEMETSALYGLGSALGHNCCTCCAIIANRIRQEYSKDYHSDIDRLIQKVLERII